MSDKTPKQPNLPPEDIQKQSTNENIENIGADDAIKLAIDLELNKLEEIEKKLNSMGENVAKKLKEIFEKIINDIIKKIKKEITDIETPSSEKNILEILAKGNIELSNFLNEKTKQNSGTQKQSKKIFEEKISFIEENYKTLENITNVLKSIETTLKLTKDINFSDKNINKLQSLQEELTIQAQKIYEGHYIDEKELSETIKKSETSMNKIIDKLKEQGKVNDNTINNLKKSLDKTINKDFDKKITNAVMNMEKGTKTFFESVKEVGEKLKKNLSEKIKENMNEWKKDTLKNLKNVFSNYLSPITQLFTISGLIAKIIEILTRFDRLYMNTFKYGESGENTMKYTDVMQRLKTDKKVIYDQQEAEQFLYDALERRIQMFKTSQKEFTEFAVQVGAFQQMTQISLDVLLDYSKTMMQYFGQTTKQMGEFFAFTRGIQKMYKLNDKEMSEIYGHINTLNNAMVKLFDRSKVETFDKSFMKVAARFKSLGVDVGKAADLYKSFVDPTAMEQNLPLLAKLGYTMEDILKGNIGNVDTMNERLKGFAQQIAQVAQTNRIQAAYMTQALTGGKFSLEDMLKLASGEKVEPQKEWTLKDLNAEEEKRNNNMTQTVKGLLNKLETLIEDILQPLWNLIRSFLAGDMTLTMKGIFIGITTALGAILGAIIGGSGILGNPLTALGGALLGGVLGGLTGALITGSINFKSIFSGVENFQKEKDLKEMADENGYIMLSDGTVMYWEDLLTPEQKNRKVLLDDMKSMINKMNTGYIDYKDLKKHYNEEIKLPEKEKAEALLSVGREYQLTRYKNEPLSEYYSRLILFFLKNKTQLPSYFQGDIVTKPTFALVGEGGEPEYIIPQSRLSNFISSKQKEMGDFTNTQKTNRMIELLELLVATMNKNNELTDKIYKLSLSDNAFQKGF